MYTWSNLNVICYIIDGMTNRMMTLRLNHLTKRFYI